MGRMMIARVSCGGETVPIQIANLGITACERETDVIRSKLMIAFCGIMLI